MRFDEGYPGGHDFDIFNQTLPLISDQLRKPSGGYYNIMADMGYLGRPVINEVELITPKKNSNSITA